MRLSSVRVVFRKLPSESGHTHARMRTWMIYRGTMHVRKGRTESGVRVYVIYGYVCESVAKCVCVSTYVNRAET